jgi:hypothetical protein
MSTSVVVRYQTRPETAAENAGLVEAVYAALAELQPAGFLYRTYLLADGVTFVHIADLEGGENPLPSLPAFASFQRELPQRCAVMPDPSPASIVGSYEPPR